MTKIRAISTLRLDGIRAFTTNALYYQYDSGNKVRSYRYKGWRHIMSHLLPDAFLPSDMTGYGLNIYVGVESEFDLDNTLKSLIDALQEKYGFNDNQLSYLRAQKVSSGSRYNKSYDPELDFIEITLLENVELDYTECTRLQPNLSPDEYGLHVKDEWHSFKELSHKPAILSQLGSTL